MKTVLSINDNVQRSTDLRIKREVSFEVAEGEASIERLISAEYVLIVGGRERGQSVPTWIAEIRRFSIIAGDYPKVVKLSLGRIAYIGGSYGHVVNLVRDKPMSHASIDHLDVDSLIAAGELITEADISFDALTAKAAALRLAWTYGVTPDQVKISIQL